jgi:hypothetical protein
MEMHLLVDFRFATRPRDDGAHSVSDDSDPVRHVALGG